MTTWVDVDLCSTLRTQGLPIEGPPEAWLPRATDQVFAAYQRAVGAGAQVLLTAPFSAQSHPSPAWEQSIAMACDIAHRAATEGVAVFGVITPSTDPDPYVRDHGLRELARKFLDGAIEGVVLSAFDSADECLDALRTIRPYLLDAPLVATLAPRADGRLQDGSEPLPWLARLLGAGATVVGFEGGHGPTAVEAAISLTQGSFAPRWARPDRGDASDEDLLAILRGLSTHCAYVGGGSGVSVGLLDQLTGSGS